MSEFPALERVEELRRIWEDLGRWLDGVRGGGGRDHRGSDDYDDGYYDDDHHSRRGGKNMLSQFMSNVATGASRDSPHGGADGNSRETPQRQMGLQHANGDRRGAPGRRRGAPPSNGRGAASPPPMSEQEVRDAMRRGHLKEKIDERQQQFERQQQAAARLQAAQRGRQARAQQQQRSAAAAKLQAVARGRQVRRPRRPPGRP